MTPLQEQKVKHTVKKVTMENSQESLQICPCLTKAVEKALSVVATDPRDRYGQRLTVPEHQFKVCMLKMFDNSKQQL